MTFGLAMEEIARGDFGCTYGIQLAGLAGEILGASGTEESRRRWLPPTARGEDIIALALTEPGVGSDAAHLVLPRRARRRQLPDHGREVGDQPGHGRAVRHALRPYRHGRSQGRDGLSWCRSSFPASRGALSGTWARTPWGELCSLSTTCASLSLTGWASEGHGFYQVMKGFDYNRVGIALACLGVAQISLEETMNYVKERRAFGRAARRPSRACRSRSRKRPRISTPAGGSATARSGSPTGASPTARKSAMTKWWGPKLAVETIHQCLLLPRPLRLHRRAAIRAAHARRHRARDRRRHRGGDEDHRRARAHGS